MQFSLFCLLLKQTRSSTRIRRTSFNLCHLSAVLTQMVLRLIEGPNLHHATSVAKCKQFMCLPASPFHSKKFGKPTRHQNNVQKVRGRESAAGERVHLCLRKLGPLKQNKCCSLLGPLVSCLEEWLYLPAKTGGKN